MSDMCTAVCRDHAMNLVSDYIPKQSHQAKQATMQVAMQHLLSKGMIPVLAFSLAVCLSVCPSVCLSVGLSVCNHVVYYTAVTTCTTGSHHQ